LREKAIGFNEPGDKRNLAEQRFEKVRFRGGGLRAGPGVKGGVKV